MLWIAVLVLTFIKNVDISNTIIDKCHKISNSLSLDRVVRHVESADLCALGEGSKLLHLEDQQGWSTWVDVGGHRSTFFNGQ